MSESTEVNGQTQSSDKSDQNVDSKSEGDEKPIKKKKSKGLKTLDNASDKQDVISEEKQTEESSTEAETERKPSKKKKKKMKDVAGLSTKSFIFSWHFIKKSLICFESKFMTCLQGIIVLFCSSKQLPRLCLEPLKGFLS